MSNAVVYDRLCSEKQFDLMSLEEQQREIRRFHDDKGLEFINIYNEDANTYLIIDKEEEPCLKQ